MIHPTAIIEPGAQIGERVTIGPYTVIDSTVTVGDDCRIGPHAHISGYTKIGAGTVIHAGAIIGDEPQDMHFRGGESYVEIGTKCILREYVTIHRGSEEGSTTHIGNSVMLMGMVHVAHNCHIEDNVIVANATLLAGHVHVGRRAFISGGVGVHQFVRIGTIAMVGGVDKITQDVPPYCMVDSSCVHGPNTIGLKRAGFTPETRQAVRTSIKLYYFSGLNRMNALNLIRERFSHLPELRAFADFIETTKRGILPGRADKRIAEDED